MPTTALTFANYQTKMRWREPYVTEGLNRKMSVAVPPGIYRGFMIQPGLANDTVDVVADPVENDHVALFQTADEYSLSIRYETGLFALNFGAAPLNAYAGMTVVIAIYGTYAAGATTTAEVRVYTQAEYDASADKPYIIVLGTVNVPAVPGAPIPATDVTHDQRTEAWMKMSPGSVFWTPLLKSSGFEWGVNTERTKNGDLEKDGLIPYWALTTVATTGTVGQGSTDSVAHSGNRSLLMEMTVGPATGVGFVALQRVSMPVTPGKKIRISAWANVLNADTGVGTAGFYLGFVDKDGVSLPMVETIPVPINAVSGGWVKYEKTFLVPATAAYLRDASFVVMNASYAVAAPASLIAVDDFQVYLECADPWAVFQLAEKAAQPIWADSLIIGKFFQDPIFSKLAAQLKFNPATPSGEGKLMLTARDYDAAFTPTVLPPVLDVQGRMWIGDGLQASANLGKARINVRPPDSVATRVRTLVYEGKSSLIVGTTAIRIYAAQIGLHSQLEIVCNAIYDNTTQQWSRELAGHGSLLYVFNAYGWAVYRYPSDKVAPFLSTSWQNITQQFVEGFPGGGDGTGAEFELGAGLLDTMTHILRPRLALPRTSSQFGISPWQRTQIMYSADGGGSGAIPGTYTIRMYRSVGAAVFPFPNIEVLDIAINTYWDGGVSWWQEDASEASFLVSFRADGIWLRTKPAGSVSWIESGWDGPVKLSGLTAPAAATGFKNTLTGKNIPKAWGRISVFGGGPVLDDGFNISSVANGLTANDIAITFATSMSGSTTYAVVASAEQDVTLFPSPAFYLVGADSFIPRTSSHFHMSGVKFAFPGPAAAPIDFTTETMWINFSVFSAQ